MADPPADSESRHLCARASEAAIKSRRLVLIFENQYTALDDCTRLRVLRLYRRLHVFSSLEFVAEVVRAFPFSIRKIQTDHGAEFPFTFVLAVERRGIRHRYIRPRCPEENGKVERSHRIDEEEFWSRQGFADFETAATQLGEWERIYNGMPKSHPPPAQAGRSPRRHR